MIDYGLAGAATLGIGGKRGLQFVGKTEVVHHQTAGFVAKDPIHPGDGLHEPVPAHRLIHVHGVQTRGVGARQSAKGIFDRLGRQVGVEAGEGLPQAALQDGVTVGGVGALSVGLARSDLGAVQHRVAEGFQPGQGGVFDHGFGEGRSCHVALPMSDTPVGTAAARLIARFGLG